ncbi:MAG: 50S ribosomal protein L5 [Candidatus Caenarcaniphilales bacterium]|nr:50S ribosomal protein L5 [Candidatus Caenarcaniphilales bacterium]
MATSLKEKYNSEVKNELKDDLKCANVHQIPKLQKIIINFGLGESASNSKTLERAIEELANISGQKPVITRARKSIAGFKLREGAPIGIKVTLRSEKMYNFFSKLVNIAMPRIRDFQGISRKSFDGKGNYTFGIKEQIIFPEIKYDQVDAIRGMDITICTSATNDADALVLLEKLGMPFKKVAGAKG